MLEGYTDNYIKVSTPFKADYSNQIIDWTLA
jgi:threonylcarbamoyladenosine tRNA methylthiotransferase MtaB